MKIYSIESSHRLLQPPASMKTDYFNCYSNSPLPRHVSFAARMIDRIDRLLLSCYYGKRKVSDAREHGEHGDPRQNWPAAEHREHERVEVGPIALHNNWTGQDEGGES